MNKTIRAIASFLWIGLLWTMSLPVCADNAVDLRGYGSVSADIKPNRAIFECESVEKADVLLDKLQADLFWDKTIPAKKNDIKLGTATVTVYSLEGYGSAVIARSGRSVVILGASDENQAAILAAKEPLLLAADVTSQAAEPHPLSLDYFDNRAFKAYVSPMKASKDFSLESHWTFLKWLGGCPAFFGPMLHDVSPAPGVVQWTKQDYEVHKAEQENDMVVVGPDGGGEMPLWVANWNPDSMMQASDTTLLGDWGGAGMVGAHYEAWSTPLAERSTTGLGFLKQAMERYRSSPAVGGWMLFAGSPGYEYNFHGRATHAWDTSPDGQEGWRNWLRDEQHLSLTDVGSRWYGNPKYFSTWNEVRVPDINEFFGQLGADSFRLDKGWKWQRGDDSISNPPAADAPGWVPVASPPSQQMAFINRSGFNYYDITFDPSDWLNKQKQEADVWLVFGMIGSNGAKVWLNNQSLAMPNDGPSRNGPFALHLTGLLKARPNHLQVALDCAAYQTCAGKLAGPVFLTFHEPKRIPYLGRGANARYADFVNWQAWAMSDYHRKMLDLARKLDPDRPIVLSGGAGNIFDYAIQFARDYGTGIENTGREASYRPEMPGEGLAAGFYSTSEWSGTPEGLWLDRGFSWILFDADSSHCLYHDIDAFQERERKDGWFTRHRRQIQMFGKYLRVQPQVALLSMGESARLNAPDGWDIGRGELQAAHYDNVYVTEEGVNAGLADRYPVLFDTGSVFMEPVTVAAIRKYVEQGGTFVALNITGLHTALEPDSYPLAALSGFKVSNKNEGGQIRFESNLPIFKGWENKKFEGWGKAVDWLNDDHAKGSNLGLIPDADSSVPLARWSDGTVAVGYRKVGKGQIITLGSTFWRDGKDVSGVWRCSQELEKQFFEKLFTECHVIRTADASIPDVWARKMMTKNGLQNWLMVFNSMADARDADVWMATDAKPDEVINLETGEKVAFESKDNGIAIKGVHLKGYEVQTFAVRRRTLAGGVPVWWNEKTTYWKRTPVELAAANMSLPPPLKGVGEAIIPLQQWHFHTDEHHKIVSGKQWTSVSFDDSGWKVEEGRPWNFFDSALKDYHGTGLYRVKFAVPASWNGRRILLNLYDADTPIVYDSGKFSINGILVASYKAHGWSQTYNYDVTHLVHPGENVLTVEVAGGSTLGGFSGSVWIESRAPLVPFLDLAGTWQAVQSDWLTRKGAIVPSNKPVTAKYLTREVQIPSEWKGKNVFVDWATKEQWVGSLVVNGHPITFNAFIHPFGLLARVNVTPYIKPGEYNVIEIWPFSTMTHHGNADREENTGFLLDSISIGCK